MRIQRSCHLYVFGLDQLSCNRLVCVYRISLRVSGWISLRVSDSIRLDEYLGSILH